MPRGRPAICPFCGGRSINKGFRLTKTMGKRRLKQCKVCRRKFTPKNQPVLEAQAKEAAPTNQNPKEEVENNEAPVAGMIAEPNETPESNKAVVDRPTIPSRF